MLTKITQGMFQELGSFSGNIIPDSATVQQALQSLETRSSVIGTSAGIIGLGGNDYFKIDSLADEASALLAAVDGNKLVYGRKSFDRTDSLTIPVKNLVFDLGSAKFNMLANKVTVSARSGIVGLFALSTNYVPGSVELVVNVTTGVLSDYYKRGKAIKIVSDAVDPSNRNEGTQALQWRIGEWALVFDIDDINNKLILAAPLKYVKGLDGQLNPPDPANRAEVDSYTTANNTRVFMPVDSSFSWYGGSIEYEEGHDGTGGWTSAAFDLQGWQGVLVDGLEVTRGYGAGLSSACYGAVLKDIHCRNLSDNSRLLSGTSLGYGIGDIGTGTTILSPRMFNTRHGFTTTGSGSTINDTSVGRLLGWGRARDCTISNGVGGGQTSVVWDTHSGADNITFVDCLAQNGQSYGFFGRGKNIKFIRPTSRCTRGIGTISEWQNNGSPDLPGLSGKGRTNLTNSYIESPTIYCQRDAITAAGAAVVLNGKSSIESGAHDVFHATGGGLIDIIGGDHDLKINGYAQASTDLGDRAIIVTSSSPTEFGIVGFQGFRIGRAARLTIDAVQATDASLMYLYSGVSGTSLEVTGGLIATLNNNFTAVQNGGALIVDQMAEWSISGTTATREPLSYFHKWPDGSISGTGRVSNVAVDAVTYIDVPVDSGIFELNINDGAVAGGQNISFSLVMNFSDATNSTSERSSLVSGNATYVEVIDNSTFASLGTSGKLCISYHDNGNTAGTGRIYINNRLGAAISFSWVLRCGNVQGL